jgi:hypothetical protein
MLLKTPQLGVAQRSPVAAVENQQHGAIALTQLRKGRQFSVGAGESEIRRALPDINCYNLKRTGDSCTITWFKLARQVRSPSRLKMQPAKTITAPCSVHAATS